MRESKSRALPLGYTPSIFYPGPSDALSDAPSKNHPFDRIPLRRATKDNQRSIMMTGFRSSCRGKNERLAKAQGAMARKETQDLIGSYRRQKRHRRHRSSVHLLFCSSIFIGRRQIDLANRAHILSISANRQRSPQTEKRSTLSSLNPHILALADEPSRKKMQDRSGHRLVSMFFPIFSCGGSKIPHALEGIEKIARYPIQPSPGGKPPRIFLIPGNPWSIRPIPPLRFMRFIIFCICANCLSS